MIGSAGDFGANIDSATTGSGEENHTVRSDESEKHNNALEDWMPLHMTQMGSTDSNEGRPVSSLPKIFASSRKPKNRTHSEGADGFSNEIKRFEFIKMIIHAADTPQLYRECLLDPSLDNVITVPVAYMKVVANEFRVSFR
jgi:hypothetical protein